ncbi:hypothetical protein BBP40_009327 [Aspergillus hancockii]|nr:hypothetical protein BBP40_009327 [Aspergillus hancockii]
MACSADMAVFFILSLSPVVGILSQLNLLAIVALVPLLGLFIVACDYFDGWNQRKALAGVPIVDEGSNLSSRFRWKISDFDPVKAYASAYQKYSKNGQPYAIRMHHGVRAIVLPANSAKEWRGLPSEQHSFPHALSEFTDRQMHLNVRSRTPNDALLACNNKPALNRCQGLLVAEADKYLPLALDPPTPHEWREVSTLGAVASVCSKIAMSLLYGPEFTADPNLMHHAEEYANLIMPSCYTRTGYPRIMRPFIWRFSPVCRKLRAHLHKLKQILTPEVRRRVQQARCTSAQEPRAVDESGRYSVLDYLIDESFKNGSLDRHDGGGAEADAQIDLIVDQSIQFHFQLFRPITMNITFMLYAIMKHPEYLAPLREEISDALTVCHGRWTSEILTHAPKLESFNREAYRLYDISGFVNIRRVMKPFSIPCLNLLLRPGTITTTPCRAVHLDPDNYADPTTFNGYRFYDAARGVCAPRVATTSPTYLTFGHGTGACPARAMAALMTRLLFVKILQAYDLQLAHETMPDFAVAHGLVHFANPAVRMRVRSRKGQV